GQATTDYTFDGPTNTVTMGSSFVSGDTIEITYFNAETQSGAGSAADIVNTELSVAATGVSAFLGTNNGTTVTSDDVGVSITGANLGLLMFKSIDPSVTTQAAAKIAVVANGTAALVGLSDLALSGRLALKYNDTGTPVTVNGTVTG